VLALPGNEDVRSANAVVAETNDGTLNDIRGRHVGGDEVLAAIRSAKGGPVEEGAVGAGTGTIAFGWKGGIGTASRKLPASLGGYTVGVLVQSNFGGVLTMGGAPVGEELGQYYLREQLEPVHTKNTKESQTRDPGSADGSIIIVVATDAPVLHRNLMRMAARGMMGLARTGASGSNGSGDYVIAFSTATRVKHGQTGAVQSNELSNEAMSPLFLAVIEATEEAIYNSMLKATTMTGNGKTVQALPVQEVRHILRKYGTVK
jgi:D-aminopeptidase